jgi:hypothetical protein
VVRKAALRLASALVFSLSAQATHGQAALSSPSQRIGSLPLTGVEHLATVGSPVFERFHYAFKRVAVPEADILKTILFMDIRIPAGAPLTIIQSKAKLKACDLDGECALDDDGDGTFDRIAKSSVSTAFKIAVPVKYTVQDIVVPSFNSFRQVTIFLGSSGDAIRLSYREFSNDLARPAFTEDLSFPLPRSFPATMAFKDVRLTVLAIDGAGMRYRIESAPVTQ